MTDAVKCPDSGAVAGARVVTSNALKDDHGEGGPSKGPHTLTLPDPTITGFNCNCVAALRILPMCDGG